ncbi:hypothetical protein [Pseudonocardia asaccharolytica]|uniref:Uncharacterized protein n=1 Tax=Pseudonocardia asaccharolytica DSM 44247 = NBRC 16224 TaxID=1123024 RepID=A0A511D125_9PSEU|nr:hypothetical protein [Pseudonocardia asaccharolytica]GEL18500.1 hypothetical protein PA7_23370 [Pseudonocardia asaccharolytica DSM 44247 = NBRC 16224]
MAATELSVGKIDVSRVAASGSPVDLTLPAAFGPFRWYGNTRFTGPRMARQFFLAPAGEHRVIPTHVLPGAVQTRRSFRGYDAVLFSAPDRSDAALVFAGPYNEATTWFGGPAPDDAGLSRLLATFSFADSPIGATLRPTSDLLVRQADDTLIGRAPAATLMVRPAADALPTLPDWAGLRLPGGELWRGERLLDPGLAALVAGTPHQWRYLLAGDSAVMDLVLQGPESGRSTIELTEERIVDALGAIAVRWSR